MKFNSSEAKERHARELQELEIELEWFGNAPFEWSFNGPLVWEHYRFWRDSFLAEAFHTDTEYPGPLNRLKHFGVNVGAIISEITQTLDLVGFDEETPGPSLSFRRALHSREQRHRDARILREGSIDEIWEVIDRWEPLLSDITPGIRITFFVLPDGRKGYLVNYAGKDRRFPQPTLPVDATETHYRDAKAYPNSEILREIGYELPSQAGIEWIARQLLHIGPKLARIQPNKQRGRLPNQEIEACALAIVSDIQKQLGSRRSCYREVGELLLAAFPQFFQRRRSANWSAEQTAMKMVQRAKARRKAAY